MGISSTGLEVNRGEDNMGYNIFNVTQLKDSFKIKLGQFLNSLGPAISEGKSITFADRDINYSLELQHQRIKDKGLNIEYEMYERDSTPSNVYAGSNWKDAHYDSTVCFKNIGVKRTVTKDGKKLYKDNRKTVSYQTITDVLTGSHPDNESYCCPSCGAVAKISELVNGCPFCGATYKMDDLFPKVTGYYFLDDVGLSGREGKTGMIVSAASFAALSCIACFIFNIKDFIGHPIYTTLSMFGVGLLGAVVGYFMYSIFLMVRLVVMGISSAGKLGTAGSRRNFENKMKSISPEFSFEYFTSKAISLIKTTIFAKNEQDLLFYKGQPIDPKFKDIIDLNYGGALGIAGFSEKDGVAAVFADAFFDVLYAEGDTVKFRNQVFRGVFMRRTDIPVNMNFSMTRIQCPTCGTNFDATRSKICPSCGRPYDLISDDWVLVELKIKK